MTKLPAQDLVSSIERARRQRGLTQAELAEELGVTQGHFSKVARKVSPLSDKLEKRALAWLEVHGGPPEADDAAALRMKELASSIRAQCMELMHLAERVLDAHGA